MMMPSTPVVELYGPDFTTIHQVPVTVVVQLPAPKLNVKRLVECLNFAAARDSATSGQTDSDEVWQTNACSAGTNCKFVHIAQPLSKFPGRAIHVHYIWQSLKSVSYRRQWGGKCEDAPFVTMVKLPDYSAEVKRYDEQRERSAARLLASGGNVEQHDKDEDERVAFAMMVDLIASVAPAMRIPATRLLKTAGSTEFLFRCQNEIQPDYELSPCPDYMCHNECRMGEECPNAHVINLDVSQGTPFVRRTLRHVKAASEATMVRLSNTQGLPAMISKYQMANHNQKGWCPPNDDASAAAAPTVRIPPITTVDASIERRMLYPLHNGMDGNGWQASTTGSGASAGLTVARTTQTDTTSSSSPMHFNISSIEEGGHSSLITSAVTSLKSGSGGKSSSTTAHGGHLLGGSAGRSSNSADGDGEMSGHSVDYTHISSISATDVGGRL